MTGTSRALRRLGVAGLSAVLMVTGMSALTATAANAANVNSQATGVDLQPPSDSATVNTCNPFTATVTPSPGAGNDYTVTVRISQPANKGTDAAPQSTTIGFCDVTGFQPSAGTNPQAPPADATPGSGTTGGTFGAGPTNAAGATCSGTSTTPASNPATLTCTAVYTTDSAGKVTFGVQSDTAGTMNVNAGVDVNQNGGVDTFEPQDNSTKTWVANTPGTANSNINCTPTSATNPAGTTHTIRCQVTTTAGTGVTGLTNVKLLVQSGPDASNTPIGCTEDTSNTTGSAAGQYGFYKCVINNAASGSKTGTDTATAWVDLNNNNVIDSGEPAQSGLQKTWVAPAPAGSTVALTCTPNPTTTAGDVCQDDPTQDKTATFTATVTNNATVPASPAANVIVNFSFTQTAGAADATDTESLSATNCTTNASGQCSVTFTDSVPVEGEGFTVTASVPLAVGGPATDTATKNFHTPGVNEARNITVTPATASQTAGGAQGFTAKVTDRFKNPVSGVTVNWSESGPGGLRGGNTCVTDATGSCSIDVTSLSSERGTETVTATIAGTGTSSECASPAGYSNYTAGSTAGPGTANNAGTSPNAGGQNNAAPGTSAGNCSASGTVNWTAPAPVVKTKIAASINCWSPRRHVLKCKVTEKPARAGLLVRFKKRTASGVKSIGTDFTNSNGVARITKRHLKSGKLWRVFAHVYATSRTTGATTGTDRTRIK